MSTQALRPEDPRDIGPYRLLARLGAGGMGSVFLGRSASGRAVAVKLVHPELARDAEFRRRFRQEVDAAREVGGEFTARVLDADPDAAVPWLATVYVAGPSLHEVVDGGYGPLPERSLRRLAAGLGHALRAVHDRGLVHRDLKPANVLLALDGPRVIDFGIARAVDSTIATRTGAVIGTPAYMSPEQVRGERVTPAGDVFSLGSVLAFAATGRLPFATDEGGVHALMMRITSAEPDLAGLEGPLLELVQACLAKEPRRRPSPEEIVERAGHDGGGSWLPAEVVDRLGRHAVALLDLESPEFPSTSGSGATEKMPATPAATPPLTPPAGAVAPPPGPPPFALPSGTPPGAPARTRRTEYRPTRPTGPEGRPSRRLPAVAAALSVAAAAVVAAVIIVAAAVSRSGDGAAPRGSGPAVPSEAGTRTQGSPRTADRDGDGPASAGSPAAGDLRPGFIGTWQGSADGGRGIRMVIRQGRRGDDVATVRFNGRGYECHGAGVLVRAESARLTLDVHINRSKPSGSCTSTGLPLTAMLMSDNVMWVRDGEILGNLHRVD
ncbi:serine/threonine-protein kinase [Actinomadura sp. 21ATH]|uniref:serine/threonine-protein kinase n=1 Tax=Actinomadura sp. 21ATH TaxID=1735444 RepID=UPI0035C05DB2